MTYYVRPDYAVSWFKNSSLYQYYTTNNLTILDDAIGKILEDKLTDPDTEIRNITVSNFNMRNINELYAYNINYLCQCYDVLIKNNFDDDLIHDMINTSNSYDNFAICLVAIFNEKLDIMQMLAHTNFDFDQHICIYSFYASNMLAENAGLYNLLSYAIRHDRINIVRYLIQYGVQVNLDSNYYTEYISQHDIGLFDELYSLYKGDRSALLFKNICEENFQVVDRLLCTDTRLNINQLKPDLVKYLISKKLYYRPHICLDILQLLVKHGLVIDNYFFQDIFIFSDIGTLDYLMTEYYFVPNNDVIAKLFQDIKFEIDKIDLLVKHNVDLSNFKYFAGSDKSDKLTNLAKICNLDHETLVAYLVDNLYKN